VGYSSVKCSVKFSGVHSVLRFCDGMSNELKFIGVSSQLGISEVSNEVRVTGVGPIG
jgi:hypothetical protein